MIIGELVSDLDVCDVIVWGNISGSFYVDLQKAQVTNYDGAVKGPAFFSLPAQKIIHDRSVVLHNRVLRLQVNACLLKINRFHSSPLGRG